LVIPHCEKFGDILSRWKERLSRRNMSVQRVAITKVGGKGGKAFRDSRRQKLSQGRKNLKARPCKAAKGGRSFKSTSLLTTTEEISIREKSPRES